MRDHRGSDGPDQIAIGKSDLHITVIISIKTSASYMSTDHIAIASGGRYCERSYIVAYDYRTLDIETNINPANKCKNKELPTNVLLAAANEFEPKFLTIYKPSSPPNGFNTH